MRPEELIGRRYQLSFTIVAVGLIPPGGSDDDREVLLEAPTGRFAISVRDLRALLEIAVEAGH